MSRYDIEFLFQGEYDNLPDQLTKNLYTPIPVAELEQIGYVISVPNGEKIVYLSSTGYKGYMSALHGLSGSIDNTMPSYPRDDIKYPKRHGR